MSYMDLIFIVICICFVFYVIKLKSKIKELELDKEISERKIQEVIDRRNIETTIHQNQMLALQNQIISDEKKILELQRLLSNRKREIADIPDGTIEAVKYAMIHNHPDNGGKAEKFILYRECYKKLTGKIKN